MKKGQYRGGEGVGLVCMEWFVTPAVGEQSSDLSPLLRAAREGSSRAWHELVRRYSRRIYALAKSRCRDSDVAEEITQSVFATVATKIGGGEYEEQGKFESWLFRVAMNRVRDHVRRMKRRPGAVEGHESELVAQSPPEVQAHEGSLVRLRRAMMELSESDREIIELRHHGGMSFKQMADLLNEPLGTLLARHHRALRKLKELMSESDDAENDGGASSEVAESTERPGAA